MSVDSAMLRGKHEVNQNTRNEIESLGQVLKSYLVQSMAFMAAQKSMLYLNKRAKWLVRTVLLG